jgi:hypothetical protein
VEAPLFFTGRYGLKEPGEGDERGKKPNKAVEARKKAEKEEETVSNRFLKGGCDVFFCNQHSRLAKQGKRI